jgi:hypothetical protein
MRKEVLEELMSRRTLISDVGEHCCYARFMLAQKCLEVPVPLLPMLPCNLPLCFGWEFHQTLHEGYPEPVYVDLWRLLTVLPNLRCHVPPRSRFAAGLAGSVVGVAGPAAGPVSAAAGAAGHSAVGAVGVAGLAAGVAVAAGFAVGAAESAAGVAGAAAGAADVAAAAVVGAG